ncbi:hypothetical protein HWI79_127 [Cryptosporidium felis]|nr:hypothetical protein HWI79_127 [Cryptosporidium felis]
MMSRFPSLIADKITFCCDGPLGAVKEALLPSCATSDDEHAVSTVIEGPLRPKLYETLFEISDNATLVPVKGEINLDSEILLPCISAQSLFPQPTYTPVLLPRNLDKLSFASSIDLTPNIKEILCCGSITAASEGDIPKYLESKLSISSIKEP